MQDRIEPTNALALMASMKKLRLEAEYHAQRFRQLRRLYRQNVKLLKVLADTLPAHSILHIEVVAFLNRRR